MSEKPLEFCPKCAGPVKRLISAAGIIFKGSGFHVTDYKKDSKGHNKPTTTPASTPKKEKPAKKKESKA